MVPYEKSPGSQFTGAKIVYQMFTVYPLIGVFLGWFPYNAYTPILTVIIAKCDCAKLSGYPPCPHSHAGGQGFKSPHLHHQWEG